MELVSTAGRVQSVEGLQASRVEVEAGTAEVPHRPSLQGGEEEGGLAQSMRVPYSMPLLTLFARGERLGTTRHTNDSPT